MSLFVRPAAVKGILLNLIRFPLRFDVIKYLPIDTAEVIFNETLALSFPLNQTFTLDFHVKIYRKQSDIKISKRNGKIRQSKINSRWVAGPIGQTNRRPSV